MEYVEGRILWEPHASRNDRPKRARHTTELNRVHCRLAPRFDSRPGGPCGDYGKPGNYIERADRTMGESNMRQRTRERIPAMDRLI
jgi:hypothetical protein